MGIFERDESVHGRLDWAILQNGWVSLYWKTEILQRDIYWFQKEMFHVVEFDCSSWTSHDIIHTDLAHGLHFPDYYGKNLSALNDCLYHIDIPDTGFVIVFRNFECVEKTAAFHLLDILAGNARSHMLFGYKLITLVQVAQPDFELEPVGAKPVMWNPSEWLNSARDL